jgi:Mn-dependent DtxR family transcriptional regulator
MTKKATTKDELYLLKLYEIASGRGDSQEAVDRLEVGRAMGLNDKGANVIARNLAQTNFIKKAEGDSVYLTDHGLRLVHSLLKGY